MCSFSDNFVFSNTVFKVTKMWDPQPGHSSADHRGKTTWPTILPSCWKKSAKRVQEKAEVFITQESRQKRRGKIRAPQLSSPPPCDWWDARCASTPRMCVRGIVRKCACRVSVSASNYSWGEERGEWAGAQGWIISGNPAPQRGAQKQRGGGGW